MTLTEFLSARIDEDVEAVEVAAKRKVHDHLLVEAYKRVLSESLAKRRILSELESMNESALDDDPDLSMAAAHTAQGLFRSACILAVVYSNHPDHQQEWAL